MEEVKKLAIKSGVWTCSLLWTQESIRVRGHSRLNRVQLVIGEKLLGPAWDS